MPDIVDAFPQASFAGVAFPYTKIGIHGGLNYHLHTYLHRPGGEIESLGRKPYEFTFHCEFHTSMRDWAHAYPELLATLINLFESEVTANLVVPNVGTVRAKAIKWPRNLAAKIRSGESVEFVFLEDGAAEMAMSKVSEGAEDATLTLRCETTFSAVSLSPRLFRLGAEVVALYAPDQAAEAEVLDVAREVFSDVEGVAHH